MSITTSNAVTCAESGQINGAVFSQQSSSFSDGFEWMTHDLRDGDLDYNPSDNVEELIAEGESIVADLKRLCGLR